MRFKLLIGAFLLFVCARVYAFGEDEIKSKVTAALDQIKNYYAESTMEMRINTEQANAAPTLLFDQRMDSRSTVDFAGNALHMEYTVSLTTKDKEQSMVSEAYINEGLFYQKIGEQWFKRPLTEIDKDVFKSPDQEKELLSGSKLEIVTDDPLYVVVIPDKEKMSQQLIDKLRVTLGDKNKAFNITMDTLTLEYWFDSQFNLARKRTLSRMKVESPNQPTQIIEESTTASYTAYNQNREIVLPADVKEAEVSPLK